MINFYYFSYFPIDQFYFSFFFGYVDYRYNRYGLYEGVCRKLIDQIDVSEHTRETNAMLLFYLSLLRFSHSLTHTHSLSSPLLLDARIKSRFFSSFITTFTSNHEFQRFTIFRINPFNISIPIITARLRATLLCRFICTVLFFLDFYFLNTKISSFFRSSSSFNYDEKIKVKCKPSIIT